MRYLITFTEEAIFDPKLDGYIGGRMEVYTDDFYPDSEYRFLTNDKNFAKFRERWEFQEVSEEELSEIKKQLLVFTKK